MRHSLHSNLSHHSFPSSAGLQQFLALVRIFARHSGDLPSVMHFTRQIYDFMVARKKWSVEKNRNEKFKYSFPAICRCHSKFIRLSDPNRISVRIFANAFYHFVPVVAGTSAGRRVRSAHQNQRLVTQPVAIKVKFPNQLSRRRRIINYYYYLWQRAIALRWETQQHDFVPLWITRTANTDIHSMCADRVFFCNRAKLLIYARPNQNSDVFVQFDSPSPRIENE